MGVGAAARRALPGRGREQGRRRRSHRRRAGGAARRACRDHPRSQSRAPRSLRPRCRRRHCSGSTGRECPARRAVPARAAESPGGRRHAPCLGGRAAVRRYPYWWMTHAGSHVDAYSRNVVRRLHAILFAAFVAVLAVVAAGCGGSAVAVPELSSFTKRRADELRRRLGAVRAHAPDDDARHRQEAVRSAPKAGSTPPRSGLS